MSTAGKVLVVLVTLTTLVWMILAAGVAQLNRNGNKAASRSQRTSSESRRSISRQNQA